MRAAVGSPCAPQATLKGVIGSPRMRRQGARSDFLHPREVPGRTLALALIWSGVASEAGAQARRLGEDAAREVVARAMRDGSHRVWDPGTRP